jgi:hypothetical protein
MCAEMLLTAPMRRLASCPLDYCFSSPLKALDPVLVIAVKTSGMLMAELLKEPRALLRFLG